MKYIADLHIHSKYSIATSKQLDPEHLDLWARIKGITVVGTGTAALFAASDLRSLFDTFQSVLGLLISPLAGLFFLGIFTIDLFVTVDTLCQFWNPGKGTVFSKKMTAFAAVFNQFVV